ncbi:MAG TPA: SIR2 family protein [Solirubrobacteraceae bacterium]|nr:SIR2 family protein [Solirubrobacteraceae bacterium]
MTFASFRDPHVQRALDKLAASDHLAVYVGAGIAAEAGLPNWSLLVRRLLTHASRITQNFQDEDDRRDWVDRTIRTELAAGAAGIAETMLERDLAKALYRELYRPAGAHQPESKPLPPASFAPGRTSHAVAALRLACDGDPERQSPTKLLTTNYDDLLERALRARRSIDPERVISVCWPAASARGKPAAQPIKVHHLHGLLAGRRPGGEITLTDRSFFRTGGAQGARDIDVEYILAHNTCLFLGTSLSDPNIARYLYRAAEQSRSATRSEPPRSPSRRSNLRHVAVFTHRPADPPAVRQVREEITRARLADALTDVVFLEHYADVAQFVYEVRNHIVEDNYDSPDKRARALLRRVLREVIHSRNSIKFYKAQPKLSDGLGKILRAVTGALDEETGTRLAGEKLAITLWLLDDSGRTLTPWVGSDRILRDPSMQRGVDVEPGSRWLSVRAVCEGGFLGESGRPERSRWSYLVGFPLLMSDGRKGRLPIGAVTVATVTESDDTWLSGLDAHGKLFLCKALNDAVSKWLSAALGSAA